MLTKNHERLPNAELRELAHWTRTHITESELIASQLPRVIPSKRNPVSKPDSWYPNQSIFQQIMTLGIPVRGNKAAFYKWMSQENPYLANQIPLNMNYPVPRARGIKTVPVDATIRVACLGCEHSVLPLPNRRLLLPLLHSNRLPKTDLPITLALPMASY